MNFTTPKFETAVTASRRSAARTSNCFASGSSTSPGGRRRICSPRSSGSLRPTCACCCCPISLPTRSPSSSPSSAERWNRSTQPRSTRSSISSNPTATWPPSAPCAQAQPFRQGQRPQRLQRRLGEHRLAVRSALLGLAANSGQGAGGLCARKRSMLPGAAVLREEAAKEARHRPGRPRCHDQRGQRRRCQASTDRTGRRWAHGPGDPGLCPAGDADRCRETDAGGA